MPATPPATSCSPASDLELLEQLKHQVSAPLLAVVSNKLQRLAVAELKIQALEARLRQEWINKYGAGSEKLSDGQMQLLNLEPGVSREEVQAESQRSAIPVATHTRKKEREHPGRQTLPVELPRVEKMVRCAPEQCVCAGCGQQKTVIGYEQSEQLDVEPAKYFVVVTKREKRACRKCEEQGVVTAPLPPRIIEKGLVSDGVVIDTIVQKYCDHVPLYRQSAILERDLGLELSRATLDGWVLRVGELLIPIAGAMKRELLGGRYLQADETPVPVQMHDGRGKHHQAYLWQYGSPGGGVVFDFRLGRGRDGPKQFLENFAGLLQTDGYVAYESVGGAGLVHAGCWSHALRYFLEAMELNAHDAAAQGVVALMRDLFAIDGEARAQNLDAGARDALRQQRAPSLLEEMKTQIEAAQADALPSSALGKACRYALGQWPKLTRFVEYPELELSNNLAENSMRPVAVGRKNWIHVGSAQAGPKIAAILSVVETCRRMKLRIRDYLHAVLPGLADLPISRTSELTPSAWKEKTC